jgi:hypothetical protein
MEEPEDFMNQNYEECAKFCEKMGAKFEDEHENEELCLTFAERREEMGIEWIRATKLPSCTNDDGDVEFLRKAMQDGGGNWLNVNLEREYSRGRTDNTMMDACLATAFWFLESKPMTLFRQQNDNVNI